MPEEAGKNPTSLGSGEKEGAADTQYLLRVCQKETKRRWIVLYVSLAVSAGRTEENISKEKWVVLHPISPPLHKPGSSVRTAQQAAERGRS